MKLILNCKFCGAHNPESNQRCHSCNAPLEKFSKINDEIKIGLSNYIQSVEEILKADKEKANGKIIIAFIILALIDVIAITGLYYGLVPSHFLLFVLLSVLITFILFITLGFLIIKFENEILKQIFNKKTKNEILEYLEQNNISKVDFKNMAVAVLPRNAFLIKFLVDL